MKTVLDLVADFAFLNDAKVRCGGRLPIGDERRWSQLKAFYVLLMADSGFCAPTARPRYSAEEIRKRVAWRDHLRVPADIGLRLYQRKEGLTGRAANLSRGGVFFTCWRTLPVKERVCLSFGIGRRDPRAVEVEGQIVWTHESPYWRADLPRGMGIRFLGAAEPVRERIDALVVAALEQRLARIDTRRFVQEWGLGEP